MRQKRHTVTRILTISGCTCPDLVEKLSMDVAAECLSELRQELGKYRLEAQTIHHWPCTGGMQILYAFTGCQVKRRPPQHHFQHN